MRRWIAVLVLGAYLCSSAELHQFLKLPAFFAHWSEHRHQAGHMGLLAFLDLHYFNAAHDEGGHEDHDLPFHCDHECMTHALQIGVPEPSMGLPLRAVAEQDDRPIPRDQDYSFLLGRDIWQPPKA